MSNRHPHPADGMTAEVIVGDNAAMTIVNPQSFADGGAEWVMRAERKVMSLPKETEA